MLCSYEKTPTERKCHYSMTEPSTAQFAQGSQATGSVSVYLPPSAGCSYDGNGKLLGDGNRNFAYNDSPRGPVSA